MAPASVAFVHWPRHGASIRRRPDSRPPPMSEREAPEVAIRTTPLELGEQAPGFSRPAIDADGEQSTATLSELVAGGPVMLVFYQDDGMPICTSELKVFAQEHDLLMEAGVQMFGINTNGIGSHQKFQERDHFPF